MALNALVDVINRHHVKGWIELDVFPEIGLYLSGIQILKAAPFARNDISDLDKKFGFNFTLPPNLDLQGFLNDTLKVAAKIDGELNEIPVFRPVVLSILMNSCSRRELELTVDRLNNTTKIGLSYAVQSAEAKQRPMCENDLGRISDDRVVIKGREGSLFLYGGSNKVKSLYAEDSEIGENVGSWGRLVRSRCEAAQERSIELLQTIIPEKTSIQPHLSPFDVSGPSPLFKKVNDVLSFQAPNYTYVDFVKCFQNSVAHDSLYRRKDSHFSSFGALEATKLLISSINLSDGVMFLKMDSEVRQIDGDLWNRFPNSEKEYVSIVRDIYIDTTVPLVPTLVHSKDPTSGVQGIERVWQCDDAPIKQRILIFGNSFFERGVTSLTLCWWFSRLFEECHFCWSNSLDWDLADSVRPNIILCQTIERFLSRIPKS